jgi:hypothetical protein
MAELALAALPIAVALPHALPLERVNPAAAVGLVLWPADTVPSAALSCHH